MKIGLIGYGKMGKIIDNMAAEAGHDVVLRITSQNAHELNNISVGDVDVLIEFTNPNVVLENLKLAIRKGIPVVCGSTGWYDQLSEIADLVKQNNGALFYAPNFSVGVNLFFELNRQLGHLMQQYPDYACKLEEIHHTEKLDKPSGTAIAIAEDLIAIDNRWSKWQLKKTMDDELEINSFREEDVKGTHRTIYENDIDRITIEHFAKSREGFAQGALMAASFIQNKQGIFTMSDLIHNKHDQ